MRVLIAPDKFAGTLSAVAAAAAIADGWRRTAPDDELVLVPLADGGPGFVDVVHASLGGELVAVSVTGPVGTPVAASFVLVDGTAYVETAQACGLHLVPEPRDPRTTTTYGVGLLLLAARDAGARRVVLGLGGSGTNDAGAGMLAALGARAVDADGHDVTDVLAGRVDVGRREYLAIGVSGAYAVVDDLRDRGLPPEDAFTDPATHLSALAARAARTWSH